MELKKNATFKNMMCWRFNNVTLYCRNQNSDPVCCSRCPPCRNDVVVSSPGVETKTVTPCVV